METGVQRVLLVTGSRTWRAPLVLNEFLYNLGWTGSTNLLLNGYAKGADQQARTAAILLGWSVKDYHPKDYQESWMSYGRACNVRNQAMVTHLDMYRATGVETRSLALWKDHSTGTGNTLDMLRTKGFNPSVMYDCRCHVYPV